MEELNLLEKLGKVKAPPDFERRVMDRLARLKGTKAPAAIFGLRLSLAGALTVLVIGFLLVNIFVFQKPGSLANQGGESGLDRSAVNSGLKAEAIPVMESLNYSQEVRGLALERGAIYILENVSDKTYQEIRY